MGDLIWMGAIVFIGSIVTLAIVMNGRKSGNAPFALGATALIMLAYTAAVAEPHAEPLKPVPQLASVIRENGRASDTIAIQGVTGGNALLFYTRPHVYALDMPYETPQDPANDPKAVICSSSRTFVVTSKKRPTVDPTYGRDRHLLATATTDVLYLYDGKPCGADVGAGAGAR